MLTLSRWTNRSCFKSCQRTNLIAWILIFLGKWLIDELECGSVVLWHLWLPRATVEFINPFVIPPPWYHNDHARSTGRDKLCIIRYLWNCYQHIISLAVTPSHKWTYPSCYQSLIRLFHNVDCDVDSNWVPSDLNSRTANILCLKLLMAAI